MKLVWNVATAEQPYNNKPTTTAKTNVANQMRNCYRYVYYYNTNSLSFGVVFQVGTIVAMHEVSEEGT